MNSTPYQRGQGARWIASGLESDARRTAKGRRKIDPRVSDFGARVADLLDAMFSGIYHLDWSSLARADWSSDRHVRVATFQELATWDFSYLTRFVVLCHDACIRGSIESAGPRYVAMNFYRREGREGDFSQRHPTIEDAIAMIRGGQ